MTHINKLHTAEALESLAFYMTQGVNSGPELHCRIWKMPSMSAKEMESFANELNRCISSICANKAQQLKKEVKDSL